VWRAGRTMSAVAHDDDVIDGDESGREWRRSRRSYGGGACVEAATAYSARIHVRDSKNPRGVILGFTSAQWTAFLAGVRSGEIGL
jgi:hypothetical protein